MPRFIKDEFDAFLECGILAHGFLRLRCGECGHDKLLAFSCKRRGLQPVMRCAADVANRGAPGGPRHPPCAGAAVGAVAADPAARAAGRTARVGHAGAAGGAARAHATSAGRCRARGRRRRWRRGHADTMHWVGREPQHTSSRPAAGRGVPAWCRWLAAVRRSGLAHRRRGA
ncbi:transposase zinc-binding domain-containing protein [Pseudomonas luteola]|uniref:transposase zinc-binding domain-containing protein n=1 Tax=Pseudomonas luteola TaxID=47886 RepID=UPI003CCC764C